MKWLRLSLIARQLIIFGLLVALLWVGSKPALGPDGRIVCVSTDYPSRVPFPRSEPYDIGTTVTISVFVIKDRKLITLNTLRRVPITDAIKYERNETLRRLCNFCPPLRQISQIETRVWGGWTYYFSLTPTEWEILEEARRNEYQLLFVPEKMSD